jgi:hypothetical protein
MKVYCIRQKSTGLFIPRFKTGQRRGGSHLEPSNEREPRVFHNALAARAFLSSWLQGIHKHDTYIDMDGVQDDGVSIVPQPHRKKDDMEIVEFECVSNFVYVVAGNDYPDCVFKTETDALAYCNQRSSELNTPKIYWRYYAMGLK